VTTIPKRWQPFRTWPTAHLIPHRVVTLLKQAGRRNCAGLAQKISSTLRAEALRQPAPVEHALGVAALGLPALEAELAAVFDQHAQAWIITASPASGPSSGLVCSANSVMTRTVSPTLTRCAVSPGTAPITRASGRSRVVLHRVGHRRFRRISRGLGMFAQQADCVRGIGDPPPLMHRLGRSPPAEAEADYYARPTGQPADTHKLRCASNPGRFTQSKSHDVDDQFGTHTWVTLR
jgi:hypothetical protein